MGSRLMVESLARGVLECISVRDMGCSSCRSRSLNSPDTLSCTEERQLSLQEVKKQLTLLIVE